MQETRGILLAGGKGTRLAPITSGVNKHLIPIYDKPMIFYSLSTLMLCGIRKIALVTNPSDIDVFYKILGDGSKLGIEIQYFEQENPNGIPQALVITQEYLQGSRSVLMLGDNLLIGQGLGETLKSHMERKGASVLAFPVSNPTEYGVVEFGESGDVISIEEKPSNPKSKFAVPGIYFLDELAPKYAKELTKSNRGEFEITDLLKRYLDDSNLHVSVLRRGSGWMDAGTVDSLFAASELVQVFQKRQGLHFNVPEEIAYIQGWIDQEQLLRIADSYKNTSYGDYLRTII